jgi:hypothetical protein
MGATLMRDVPSEQQPHDAKNYGDFNEKLSANASFPSWSPSHVTRVVCHVVHGASRSAKPGRAAWQEKPAERVSPN